MFWLFAERWQARRKRRKRPAKHKFSKNRRINALNAHKMRRSIDFSKISVLSAFCGILRACTRSANSGEIGHLELWGPKTAVSVLLCFGLAVTTRQSHCQF